MRITKNFTLEELTRSEYATRHGIDNTAPPNVVLNLKLLCEDVMQPLRDAIEVPIIVSSGYRSMTVNRGVGSSDNSQHPKGEAIDCRAIGMTPTELFKKIIELKLPFDQLIEEFEQWIHVSRTSADRGNRNQKFLARHNDEGKVVYIIFEET